MGQVADQDHPADDATQRADTKLAVKFAYGNRFVARPGSEKTARSFSAVSLLLEDEASRVLDDLYN